ncbi:hypothetical protein [Aeromicrobium sp.]|uniref:hypothetical protein n=1 Tax=Aeromicrobium sp. TaxID=1871063 RepID=UPI00199E26C1|nr:hypothetical protein [Aeromicrobium sp.]MBC7633610.1 hypothetical protein [Aeromicrobium sp.]
MRADHPAVAAAAARACDELITFDSTLELLATVANTPAPSGASSITRGARVRAWFVDQDMSKQGTELHLDYQRTGCDLLTSGTGGLRMLAHLDEVSYLVDDSWIVPGLWPISPYCYHLAEGPAPARVVRFHPDGTWTAADRGEVIEEGGKHFFRCAANVDLGPGDRICLASELACDRSTGLVTGSLDNAAGVTAALLAASVLAEVGVPFTLILTDEEEGPSGASSQTISRGAARYFHRSQLQDAPLTVAIDIHGVPARDEEDVRGHAVPWGASLAEFSSHGRGSVAPPQLYAAARDFLCKGNSIVDGVRPNSGGYVPRSDDVVAMTHTNRVLVLGYPGANRHFDRGLPSANLHDLMQLARALVALAVGVSTEQLAVDW